MAKKRTHKKHLKLAAIVVRRNKRIKLTRKLQINRDKMAQLE